MHRLKTLALGAALGAAPSGFAAVIHVPGDAPSISAGVALAIDGDEVVVGDGTWTGTANRNVDLQGKRVVVRSAGGPGACTIDCGLLGRAFVLTGGETLETRIEGFTIRRAAVNGTNQAGGAIRAELGAGLTLANCVFDECRLGMRGRGAAVWSGGPLVAEDCVFRNGTIPDELCLGGAICAVASTELRRCAFESNDAAGGWGGAVAAYGDLLVDGCAFSGNLATIGGAIHAVGASTTIADSSFDANVAVTFGGAVSFGGESLDCERCTFAANAARGAGAISAGISGSTARIDRCRFRANAATDLGGGAVRAVNAQIVSAEFVANTADSDGGAVLLVDGTNEIVNCTIVGNLQAVGAGAAGVHLAAGSAAIANTILWGNETGGAHDQAAQLSATAGALAVDHSCVDGLDGTLGGAGNLGDDPLLVDPAGPDGTPGSDDDDLRLGVGSPCIDAGRDDALPADATLDLLGNARITGAAVDLGAIEFRPCVGDVDASGAVEFADLLALLGAWGDCAGCAADLDGDAVVGFSDLLVLLGAWGPCP